MKRLEIRYATDKSITYAWIPDGCVTAVKDKWTSHETIIGIMIMKLNRLGVLDCFTIGLREEKSVPDWVQEIATRELASN